MQATLRAAALLLCTSLPVLANTPEAGWQLSTSPNPVFGAATATLSNGDIITYDGLSVDRWSSAGGFLGNVATFPVFGFASFVVVRPTGSEVIVGESSQNGIYRVPLSGTGPVLVTTVVFNHSAAFENNSQLIVSAATGGFGTGNDILRVNVNTGLTTQIADVAGPSGPVAIGPLGTLYYATQDPNFPSAPGSTDVLSWTSAQTHSGVILDESDAQVVGAGFDGGSSLAVDPVSGAVYLAESSFGQAQYRLLQVGPTQASSAVVASSPDWISNLDIVTGPGAGSFEAFQPEDGVNLKYNTTDFSVFDNTVLVRPKRPTLIATGPGTIGAGEFTLEIDGGLPNGAVLLLFQNQSTLLPTETSYPFFPFLLHSTFVPGQIRRVPFLIPVDGSGHGEVTFFNPGNLNGLNAFQAWVTKASGAAFGATPVVSL